MGIRAMRATAAAQSAIPVTKLRAINNSTPATASPIGFCGKGKFGTSRVQCAAAATRVMAASGWQVGLVKSRRRS
jgi:hypothetical protein